MLALLQALHAWPHNAPAGPAAVTALAALEVGRGAVNLAREALNTIVNGAHALPPLLWTLRTWSQVRKAPNSGPAHS